MKSKNESDGDLVAVFETADVALLPVAKSVLEAAGIPFLVQGEEALGLLPVGRFATGLTQRGQGMVAIIHVAEERADEVRELLAPLKSDAEPES